MIDPHKLDKENADAAERLRIGGEVPTLGFDPVRAELPVAERKSAIEQEAGAPWGDTGALAGYQAQVELGADKPQDDDWLPVPFNPRLRKDDDSGKSLALVWPGFVLHIDYWIANPTVTKLMPTGMDVDTEYEVAAGKTILVKVETDEYDVPEQASVVVMDNETWTNTRAHPAAEEGGYPVAVDGVYHYPIVSFKSDGGFVAIDRIYQVGHIQHVGNVGSGLDFKLIFSDGESGELGRAVFQNGHAMNGQDITILIRTGQNLNLTVQGWGWDPVTKSLSRDPSDPTVHYWRNGLYVGTNTPSDPPGLVVISAEVSSITT